MKSLRNGAAGNWVLHAAGDESAQRKCVLASFPFTVGRKPEANLRIASQTVSGLHAEFTLTAEGLRLRDAGSTNGTFVNGNRLRGECVVRKGDLIQFADATFNLAYYPVLLESGTMREDFCDRALAVSLFSRMLREKACVAHYQPIVELSSGATVAYEVLARSSFPGLQSAAVMFSVAEELGRAEELSRTMRAVGIETAEVFPEVPHLFLNTHPRETSGDDWLSELRRLHPWGALTIEIHEAAAADVSTMLKLRHRTKELGIGLAFDDFGVGQARLAEILEILPDCVKFDRRIIQDVDRADAKRRRFIACLVDAIREVGVRPLAEGVETAGECEACRELGFELAQGYHFGRPQTAESYMRQSGGSPLRV